MEEVSSNNEQQDFKLVSVSQLPSSSSSAALARFSVESGKAELRFHQDSDSCEVITVDLTASRLFRLGAVQSMCVNEGAESNNKEKSLSKAVSIEFSTEIENQAFHSAFQKWAKKAADMRSAVVESWEGASGVKKNYVKGVGHKRRYSSAETCSSSSYSSKSSQTSPHPPPHTPADCLQALCQDKMLLARLSLQLSSLTVEDMALAQAQATAATETADDLETNQAIQSLGEDVDTHT